MKKVIFFLIGGCLLIAGCATTGTERVKSGQMLLLKKENVVSSLDRISFQPIKIGEPLKFEFDEQDAIIQLEGIRRLAKGIELPTGHGAFSISITSYREGTLADPSIMYPEVRILDEKFHTVRIVPADAFVLRASMSVPGLNTVFFVNNNAQGERYLLITNRPMTEATLMVSQSNITNTVPLTIPVGAGFVTWYVTTGKNTPPIRMKASPTGSVEIVVQEYRLKKVGQN